MSRVTARSVRAEKITTAWLDTHQWFLRTSNAGVSYNGFRRKRIGAWNDAPEWTGTPTCQECGGYFGIDAEYNTSGLLPRSTLELCEWRGERVVIDADKICVSSYRVVAVDASIPDAAFERCGYRVLRKGTLDKVPFGERVLVRGTGRCQIGTVSGGGYVRNCDQARLAITTVAGGGVWNYGKARLAITTINDGVVWGDNQARLDITTITSGSVLGFASRLTIADNHRRQISKRLEVNVV